MEDERCPNGKQILYFAKILGLQDPKLICRGSFGWALIGKGKDSKGWPLVWEVADMLKISRGGGSTDFHQIDPRKFDISHFIYYIV